MLSSETVYFWTYAAFLLMAAAVLAPLIWAAVLDGRYHAMRINRLKRN